MKIPRWARIVLILGAVLAVASTGTIVGARMLIDGATAAIPQTTLIEGDARAPRREQGKAIDGAINLLLVGIDARDTGGGSDGDSVRSDTIIILHIPKAHDRAYLISVPRDWLVDIPAYRKNGFAGISDKINTAFSAGYAGDGDRMEKLGRGVDLLSTTLNKTTGIQFDGAAIIDFDGFASVIHALGGVDMCVAEAAESAHLGVDADGKLVQGWYSEAYGIQLPPGAQPFVHRPGCRTMSATEALDYSRIRKSLPNGDYDRQNHQQQLIKAIVDKATTRGVLTDLGKLNDLVAAAGDAFVLDTGDASIADYVFTLRNLRADDMVLLKTNAGKTNTQFINGTSFEMLDQPSMDMLTAAKNGTLDTFLTQHPDYNADSPAADK
ncbi:LCP family protein [Catenuloplanes atrovinosus]|uniref:LCP family protein required for cell wall assembly n=1 Tax=Catenuloplanes atrovinosus TaxID=137266 RepID=A0AAE4CBE8_9ACTN|nr:LCP family protein [Catenuloplanes atrovinosus]MDR7276824.1 LCP family protein required for cell wall assembly [Catenuloplanes atrovinosus]